MNTDNDRTVQIIRVKSLGNNVLDIALVIGDQKVTDCELRKLVIFST